jgi:hypothetical protein
MSANNITFLERAAFIEAFGIDRQIGAGASYSKDHYTLSAGIFGESVSSSPFFSGFTGDENLTFAARGAVAPINRDVNGVNQVLHFGAGVQQRDVGDDQPFLCTAREQRPVPGQPLRQHRHYRRRRFIVELEAAACGDRSRCRPNLQLDVDLGDPAHPQEPAASGANPFIGVPDPSLTAGMSMRAGSHRRTQLQGRQFGRVKVRTP